MGTARLHARLALVGLSAASVAACAGILGIDDRSLDTQGDASTIEGGHADGGTDSASTSDGPGGDAVPADGPGGDAPGTDGPGNDAPATEGGPTCPDPCTLATGLNHPFLMTSDANNVYWTEFGDVLGSGNGQVRSCPVTGCGSSGPFAYAVGLTNPRGIAVDSQNVYFGTATYSAVNGGIWSCPITGCNGSAHQLAPAGIPFGIAVDSTYVYWADNDSGEVHRVLKGGGSDIVLYDAGTGLTPEPEQVVVDSAFVYLTTYSGDLFRLPIGGGVPTTMAPGAVGGGWPVVVDSTYAYYAMPGQVVRVPKTSTDGGVPIATNIPDPDGLAIDLATGSIYWSNWGSGNKDGTVGKAATDGGSQGVLRASLVTPEAITVSGSNVFWISNGTDDGTGSGATLPGTGTLMRTAK